VGQTLPRGNLLSALSEQTTGHNSDRQSTLRGSRSRTLVLSKEIQNLKEEKGRQVILTLGNDTLLRQNKTLEGCLKALYESQKDSRENPIDTEVCRPPLCSR